MKIIFDADESAIVGYTEISGDFKTFDFSNKLVAGNGEPPIMLYSISISGDGCKVKAE
jgi:hypothetical protein